MLHQRLEVRRDLNAAGDGGAISLEDVIARDAHMKCAVALQLEIRTL